MTEKDRCRKVSRLLQTMPKGGCEETLRMVSDHLSECEVCKSLRADLQEMDEALIASEAWFDEVARESRISRSRIITQMAPLARRRAWRLRALWAGAAAILLVIAGAAVFLLFDKGGHVPTAVRPRVTQAPLVTRAMAAASSSRTLLRVADVVSRREAPSLGLLSMSQQPRRESFFPPFLRQCAIESDARVGGIVQSRVDLSTASAALRQSFVSTLREQSTRESDGTLGRILGSRINLTRRNEL